MPRRYIGDAVIKIDYRDREDDYRGSIRVGGKVWRFDGLRAAPASRLARDSAKAYDEMAVSAVGFGSYYTSTNRGADVPDWAPDAEVADAIDEATMWASDGKGGYEVKRKKPRENPPKAKHREKARKDLRFAKLSQDKAAVAQDRGQHGEEIGGLMWALRRGSVAYSEAEHAQDWGIQSGAARSIARATRDLRVACRPAKNPRPKLPQLPEDWDERERSLFAFEKTYESWLLDTGAEKQDVIDAWTVALVGGNSRGALWEVAADMVYANDGAMIYESGLFYEGALTDESQMPDAAAIKVASKPKKKKPKKPTKKRGRNPIARFLKGT